MKGILVGTALLAGSLHAQDLTIKGKVNGDTKGYNKVYIYGTGVKSDSTVITDGTFEFRVPYTKGMVPVFYSEFSKSVSRMYRPFPLLVEGPGTVYLTDVDIAKGINSGKWKGMKSAEDYQMLDAQLSEVYTAAGKELSGKYAGDKEFYRNPAYNRERDSLVKIMMPLAYEKFIKSNPDSYAAAFALSGMGRSALKTEDLQRLYNMLSKKGQQSESGKNISDYLTGLRSSAIGSYVKNFTLPTPEGTPLSFDGFKGKYVLIDFWASWCGPCKQSFPHMKEVYKHYKSDKFEIYSISIDKDKEAWLKELKVQGLPWMHSLDNKNVSQSGFAVTGVPTTYLVDPQGKIIMKEVGFEPGGNSPLEKKLVELFGDKGLTSQATEKKEVKKEGVTQSVPMMKMQ